MSFAFFAVSYVHISEATEHNVTVYSSLFLETLYIHKSLFCSAAKKKRTTFKKIDQDQESMCNCACIIVQSERCKLPKCLIVVQLLVERDLLNIRITLVLFPVGS